jgi:gas vesicle protein
MLGVGMVIGAVIGAGIALLVAPASGHETRRLISRRAGGLRGRPGVWGKLGRELRKAAAAKRKVMEVEARQREVALRRAEAARI